MSFMYRYRKPVVISAIGLGFIMLLATCVFFLHQQAEQEQLREQLQAHYEKKIKELQTMEQAAKTRILVASRILLAGTTLQAGDVRSVEVSIALVASGSIKEQSAAVGKITKIDLQPNTPLVASMLFEDKPIPRDLRFQEFNVIQLPTNLQKSQFVDVRINFPTGEDYIILAKKKVREVAGTIVWVEMNEKEILMASSAIIDAYLQGAKLYALTYVDPGIQEAAIANYPSNQKVLDLMERDPNVLEEAKSALARQLRTVLDNNLKAMSDADKMRVVSGAVTVQQQLQNERITTQQNNAMRQTVQQQAEQQAVGKNGQAAPKPNTQTESVPSNTSPSPMPDKQTPVPDAVHDSGESTPDGKPPQTGILDDIFDQPSAKGPAS
ncbi:SAF domain-containing protein [Cohnella sp.]|uniref:SAF domain-containing protein n=1 Tax=Cohnella sp. TaxID=1883426 RepID=UPI0035655346